MYNVLLVDDEELDLEGMRQFIPWSQLGMEVRGCVNNALSACEVLNDSPIDILVSDVNMPYMSGLELAKVAMERKPAIRIIFVSGYQEFSYVQQALSLKAYNYVLKPMDDSELIATLLKVKKDLDEERKQQQVEEAYQQLIPLVQNDYMIRLLEGDGEADEKTLADLPTSCRLDAMEWPMRVAVAELDGMPWRQEKEGTPKQPITPQFLKCMHDALQQAGRVPSCRLSAQRMAFLLPSAHAMTKVERIYSACIEQLPVTVTIGLGEPVRHANQLSRSYYQAVEAVQGKMFLGKGTIIQYENVRAEPEMLDFRTLDIRMNALLNAVTTYDLVGIYDEIDNVLGSMKSLWSKYTVHNVSSYMIWKLEQHLSKMDEDLFKLLDIGMGDLDILMTFETVDDIRGWLIYHLFQLSERLHLKRNGKEGKFVRSIAKWMEERLSENITLKDVAQHFSFSPSYLGFLIKEKSGQTFSEMLVQLRMERACELLRQPGKKIYEVADEVGYRYLPYFSRQFKEKFGITPLEYRKREMQ
ncbi:response regulator [Paenibacillus sp. J5C_2022]|uniref:response regulator n=1 Tax=Paenibacillus sp. J5C2022 TaxID=2977129 RepID=UPI0021CED0E3|nr:response regulator [Paenibacillus sp. J5C2022]MCU6710443.1 response regulator [Paenibacillus sp. J5C2022]